MPPKPEPVRAKEFASKLAAKFQDTKVDWIAKNEFEVVYFVNSATKPGLEDFVIAIAVRVPRDNPVLPTLTGVWPGAEFDERETHEMFGINFQGHPNQGHLLLPEDWNDLPPLRKDYNSPGR